MGRIVVFGATGYTGGLVAGALAERGAEQVLAGRTRAKVEALASKLGTVGAEVADVGDPRSVAALVGSGDVLVTTVGPFSSFGQPALAAAVGAGAHYVDSTGEAAFLREVFERWGPKAEAAGSTMLPAFGYDWAPGNYAAALALEEAGDDAVRVDVGYFVTGGVGRRRKEIMSGGTLASIVDVWLTPGYAFRDGKLRTDRIAARHGQIEVGGRMMSGVSMATTEVLSLPRVYSGLRDINVWLGWFGPASGSLSRGSRLLAPLTRVKPVRAALARAALRMGSRGGPSEEARAKGGSLIAAEALDAAGQRLSHVELTGPNAYTLTGALMAEAAIRLADGRARAAGALGPVEAFGIEELALLCEATGLERSA